MKQPDIPIDSLILILAQARNYCFAKVEYMPLLSSLVQCTMCILNTLARNGRYPDIAATAIQRLCCKTVKVPETAGMEIVVKRQSVECGRLDLRRSMEALEYG